MELNIVRNQYGMYALAGTPIPGVAVIITGAMSWSGTTDSSGKAKDINNSPPNLIYGNYNVSTNKTGYTNGSGTFSVPTTTSLTITMSLIFTQVDITVTD